MRYVNEADNYNKKAVLMRALETPTGLTSFTNVSLHMQEKIKNTFCVVLTECI